MELSTLHINNMGQLCYVSSLDARCEYEIIGLVGRGVYILSPIK